MSLLQERTFYKPHRYPWAFDLWLKHEQMHWLPEEVEFREDISDWNSKLSPEEKNLLTQLFRFFTQADCDVAGGYAKIYLPNLSKHPEITMMMSGFAAREAIHIHAYSTLIETLDMPENTYQVFTEFKEMAEKHNYVSQFKGGDIHETLKGLAVYSAFTEGMQLFSSFAILMNFERFNKMKSMCNIVRWSIKDESLHVEGMTQLFKELLNEVSENDLNKENLKNEIAEIAIKMVDLEDKFVDLCFSQGEIQGITPEEVKDYIRFITNTRWNQLGYTGYIYPQHKTNPLGWLDWVVNGVEHANFFEARPTEYSKGTLQGEVNDW